MCLIIANFDGRPIPTDFVEDAHYKNRDGFGIMWADPTTGDLKVQRGLFKIDKIHELFKKLTSERLPYVAHFRMSTHGEISAKNCHPFPLMEDNGGVAMVHNGCFSNTEFYNEYPKSDTHVMADKILGLHSNKHISAESLFDTEVPDLHRFYTSEFAYNKVVFMNGIGEINIVGESDGYWINGVWYSNIYSIGSEMSVRRLGYDITRNTVISKNAEKFSLMLSTDVDLSDEDEFISDEDVIEEYDFCDVEVLPLGFTPEDYNSEREVSHPFASADGYSGKKYTRTKVSADNKLSFEFEGRTYEIEEQEAAHLTREDIEELIEEAESKQSDSNSAELSRAMVQDLVSRSGKKDEDITEKFSSDDFDDDDDDAAAWSQFYNDYKKSAKTPLLLAENTTSSSTTTPKTETKEFSTVSSGSRTTQYPYTRGYNYSQSEYYSSTTFARDPLDLIVEELIKA